jgi:hypothetical protein
MTSARFRAGFLAASVLCGASLASSQAMAATCFGGPKGSFPCPPGISAGATLQFFDPLSAQFSNGQIFFGNVASFFLLGTPSGGVGSQGLTGKGQAALTLIPPAQSPQVYINLGNETPAGDKPIPTVDLTGVLAGPEPDPNPPTRVVGSDGTVYVTQVISPDETNTVRVTPNGVVTVENHLYGLTRGIVYNPNGTVTYTTSAIGGFFDGVSTSVSIAPDGTTTTTTTTMTSAPSTSPLYGVDVTTTTTSTVNGATTTTKEIKSYSKSSSEDGSRTVHTTTTTTAPDGTKTERTTLSGIDRSGKTVNSFTISETTVPPPAGTGTPAPAPPPSPPPPTINLGNESADVPIPNVSIVGDLTPATTPDMRNPYGLSPSAVLQHNEPDGTRTFKDGKDIVTVAPDGTATRFVGMGASGYFAARFVDAPDGTRSEVRSHQTVITKPDGTRITGTVTYTFPATGKVTIDNVVTTTSPPTPQGNQTTSTETRQNGNTQTTTVTVDANGNTIEKTVGPTIPLPPIQTGASGAAQTDPAAAAKKRQDELQKIIDDKNTSAADRKKAYAELFGAQVAGSDGNNAKTPAPK